MSEDMPRTVSVTDEKILAMIDDAPSPIATTADLAERLPIEQDGIRRRLKLLEEEGRVASYNVGARATVWWRTD